MSIDKMNMDKKNKKTIKLSTLVVCAGWKRNKKLYLWLTSCLWMNMSRKLENSLKASLLCFKVSLRNLERL